MTGGGATDGLGVSRFAARLAGGEAVSYAFAVTAWVTFHTLPVAAGLLLRAVLDRLPASAGGGVWLALAALAGVQLARWALLAVALVQLHGCWVFWASLPRLNLLRSLVGDRGPVARRLPGSPGEAVSRFRDDTGNVAQLLDVWLDIAGAAVATTSALVVMVQVDARTTVVVALPVVVALWLCRWLGHRLRTWRRREREATGAVTGFIGDVFGAIGTVKLAGAGPAVAARFERLGDARAEAARVDQVATQVLFTTGAAVGDLGTGLVLLLLVPALARGDAGVGDVGLFATAVTVLAGLPRWAARFGATSKQAEVSVERLTELLPEPVPARVVARADVRLRHGPRPPVPAPIGADGDALRRFEVRGLTVDHGAGGGLHGVDLVVERGSLTVVTGPVGAGKSTLLRAALGLVGRDAGEVRWNGRVLDDPATALGPPRTAYVAQTPRLFSESLADAVLLGADPAGLDLAVGLACLDGDVERMPEGLATVVGARGVRLSGGQVQRTAAARALVRRPELLVIDDLSSALDVETEARLWRGLLDERGPLHSASLLVVSHRPAVLARADQVVTLDAGRVLTRETKLRA